MEQCHYRHFGVLRKTTLLVIKLTKPAMAPGSLLILFTDPGFMLFNSLQRHIQQIQITNHRGLSKCQEKQTEKDVFIC